jgi:hypothetical protein
MIALVGTPSGALAERQAQVIEKSPEGVALTVCAGTRLRPCEIKQSLQEYLGQACDELTAWMPQGPIRALG